MLLFVLSFHFSAFAQSQRFTEIQYDEVGRVQSVETAVEAAAPVVSGMVPAIVRHGPPVSVTVSGSSLRGAVVTASDPRIAVSAVSTAEARVTLSLQVPDSVPLDAYRLSLTTALGEASVAFDVYPRLPVLSVTPNPLALTPGESRTVSLHTDRADVIEHRFALSTQPGTIVTSTPSASLLPVGSTDAGQVTVSALALGNAVLRVESDEIADVAVPVFVTPRYQPPVGGADFYSTLLGVAVGERVDPRLIDRGPFTALLGVVMPVASTPSSTVISPLSAPLVGISRGAIARQLQPARVVRGAGPTTVDVLGFGLDAVQSVSLDPPDDVSLSLASIEEGGLRARLSVEATANAVRGGRLLRLARADGTAIAFATPDAAQLRIVDPMPELQSTRPLLLLRGSNQLTLDVRGIRLAGARALRLSPADGVTVGGTPVVSADGSRLSVDLAVAADAPLGPRVVIVETDAGESIDTPLLGNTVQVVDGIDYTVTPVVSAALGIARGTPDTTPASDRLLTSARLGVSRGAVFEQLAPAAFTVGDTGVLRISGVGLQSVDRIVITPADGLSLGTLTASAEGGAVDVGLTVSANAPRGSRRVQVFAGPREVLPVQPAAAVVRITLPQPQIESISPLLWVPGAAPASLSVRGRNLADVQALRVSPSEGITVSAPTIAADGQSLTATLSVAPGAALGARVVVLETPTTQSDEMPGAANSLYLVSSVAAQVSPLSAPVLGVSVGEPVIEAAPRSLLSSALGVFVAVPDVTAMSDRLLPSTKLGVVAGAAARSASPRYFPVGANHELRVEGVGLSGVDALQIEPAQGIDIAGTPVVAADGLSLSVPVTVAIDAAQGTRQLTLTRQGTALPFADPAQAVLQIVGNEPRIDSIDPIQVLPGQTLSLTIRGTNLSGVSAVTATPSTGLTFSANPQGNADGSRVVVALTIAAGAPAGPRVIRVVTSAGTTTEEAIPANTLTVVTGQ